MRYQGVGGTITGSARLQTTTDSLLGGRVTLRQPQGGLRAGLDAVMLAAAVPARPGERVLEAGCGSGAVFLCLATRVPDLEILAIERDASLAALARSNAEAAGLAARVTVITGDVADPSLRQGLPRVARSFANPPYWPGGTRPPGALRGAATHETEAGLADWAASLAAPLRHLGTLTLILPASRWDEAAVALRGAGCGSLAMKPLLPARDRPAKRVLLEARRGGRGAARISPGLVLHAGAGWSPEAEAVLRDAAALPV